LEKDLETGEQYEIIAKRTPGRNIPIVRRNSSDRSLKPLPLIEPKPLKAPRLVQEAEERLDSLGKIPADLSAQVTFQLEGQ
jgi:hypothetical protein